MQSTQPDKIFIDVHLRRLQRLRVAQQGAFEEAEFLHSFKAVHDRLEAEFLYSLRKADAIAENQKERRKASFPFRHTAPRGEQLWEDEDPHVRYPGVS